MEAGSTQLLPGGKRNNTGVWSILKIDLRTDKWLDEEDRIEHGQGELRDSPCGEQIRLGEGGVVEGRGRVRERAQSRDWETQMLFVETSAKTS